MISQQLQALEREGDALFEHIESIDPEKCKHLSSSTSIVKWTALSWMEPASLIVPNIFKKYSVCGGMIHF